MTADPGLVMAPIDSVRVVAEVYSVSLLATAPFVVAAAGALLLRHASAGSRALVWRIAVVCLLVLFAAQLLPARWEAGIVPAGLAGPLVELGRVQAAAAASLVAGGVGDAPPGAGGLTMVRFLAGVYWSGVVVVLVSLLHGWFTARRLVRGSHPIADPSILHAADACRHQIGIAGRVDVRVLDGLPVPVAVGLFRPVVLLPATCTAWSAEHLRAAMLHELAHVHARDVGYRVAAQLVCALFWFHPCAWWVARELRETCELACDDRVLDAGVRASEYGALLLRVADAVYRRPHPRTALALTGQGGLARRVMRLADGAADRRAPGVRAANLALAAATAGTLALGLVQLGPSRAVLRGLMHDARWESRAFAVLGLAPRADSIAVARAAAAHDPHPKVRALASYALAAAHLDPVPSR